MDRAYSILTVKSVDADARTIRGVATTPTPDRMGDVVEPRGVRFKNPSPLLWQHRSDQPVGLVTFDRATDKGITFEATLPQIAEAGALKDRVDEAWQSVKAGLVAAVSIGFRALEDGAEMMKGGGIRFTATEVLELSLVTIPANADATITLVKSLDAEGLAASGRKTSAPETIPAATGEKRRMPVVKGKTMAKKSISEQLASWEETRVAKSAELADIMGEDGGETLDAAGQEAFDAIEAELDSIQGQIKRLKVLEKHAVSTARPVDGSSVEKAQESRGSVPAQVKAAKPAPGIRFARYARCVALAKQGHRDVVSVAREQYGERDPEIVNMVSKAAVTAINTTDDAALIGNEGGFADFVDFLRDKTIIGRFGQNGIPSLRRVPFYFPLVNQATGGTAYWVGEGKGKPMTRPTFGRTELTPLTVAALAASTIRALQFSSPSAEMALRDDLAAAVIAAEDAAFILPTNAGSAGVKPASIANGVSAPITSGGQDADAVRDDVRQAMAKFVASNNDLTQGVWVMSGSVALGLSIMQNALGQTEFPGITMNGGTFFGLPVIVSNAASSYVILMNAADVWLADDGNVSVDISTEASLEMLDDALEGDSVAGAPAEAGMVSMFQTNSVAIRVERSINWARRRATGVTYISGVTWGTGAT